MAQGIKVVPQKEYEPSPDKSWYVNGFEFISTDESGAPHFKLNKNNDLVVNIRFATIEGKDGPPMSLSPAEFVALVRLFGIKEFNPSKQARTQTAVLIEARNLVNKAANTITVESKGGWVNAWMVDGLRPPEGRYTVKIKSAFPEDFGWIEGKNDNQYIILRFEIVGSTVWEGFEISTFVNNIFVEEREVDGELWNAKELEMPIPLDGVNYKRWDNFGKFFCNNLWERHDWKVSPSQSKYGVCEVLEPQKVLVAEALEIGAQVEVYYGEKERGKGWGFDLAEIHKFNTLSEEPTATIADFVTYVKSKEWTYTDKEGNAVLIDNSTIFETENPITFVKNENDKSVWAENFLGGEFGIWKHAGLSLEDRRFEVLTPVELGRLMSKMKERYN